MIMKAAAISGAMGIAGGIIDNAFQQESQRRQHEYEKENMAIQNSYQLAQWSRENAYNSPEAVRRRYEQAGINPATALGQSSASGAGLAGSFGSAPSASTSAGSYSSDFGGILGTVGSNLVQARTNQLNEQRIKAQNEETYQNAKKLALQNEEEEYKKANGVWEDRIKDEKAKAKLSSANAVMAEIRSLNYDLENKLDLENKQEHVNNLRAKIEHYYALIDQIEELTPEQKKELKARADNYRAHTSVLKEEQIKAEADNDLYRKFGVRPGMNLQQALVSIGANVLGVSREWIEDKVMSYINSSGDKPVSDKKLDDNAYQKLANELAEKRSSDKGYKEWKDEEFFSFVHNVLANMK